MASLLRPAGAGLAAHVQSSLGRKGVMSLPGEGACAPRSVCARCFQCCSCKHSGVPAGQEASDLQAVTAQVEVVCKGGGWGFCSLPNPPLFFFFSPHEFHKNIFTAVKGTSSASECPFVLRSSEESRSPAVPSRKGNKTFSPRPAGGGGALGAVLGPAAGGELGAGAWPASRSALWFPVLGGRGGRGREGKEASPRKGWDEAGEL